MRSDGSGGGSGSSSSFKGWGAAISPTAWSDYLTGSNNYGKKSSKKPAKKITGAELLTMLNQQNQGPFANLPDKSGGASSPKSYDGLIYRGNQPNFVELNNQAGFNDPRSGAANANGSATNKNTSGGTAGWSHMATPGKGGKSNPGMPDGGANSATPPSFVDTWKYSYDGPSADAMAKAEFAPQFSLVDNQRKQSDARYAKAGKDVGGMYDALAKAMQGEEKDIQAQTKGTTNSIGNAYNDAIASTKKSFTDSNAQTEAMARRLGLSEAVPSAEASSNDTANLLAGLLNANKANSVSTSQQLGQNEVDYNRNSAGTAGLAGVNARNDYQNGALAADAGFDNQKLSLTAGQAAAKNKYGLTLSDMEQQAELSHAKIASDQQQAAMAAFAKAQQDAADNEFRQAQLGIQQGQLDLNTDKFNYNAEHPKPAAAPKPSTDPYERLATTAASLYGNPVSAGNAVKAVEDTLTRGGHFNNVQDFINMVLSRNGGGHPQDAAQLQQLATNFYTMLTGNAGKPLG